MATWIVEFYSNFLILVELKRMFFVAHKQLKQPLLNPNNALNDMPVIQSLQKYRLILTRVNKCRSNHLPILDPCFS